MALAATAASAVMGMLLAVPAAGAESKKDLLQLSQDGVHFGAAPAPTLFRSSNGYVPGESRRDTVWVRNGGTGTAHLSLGIRNTGAAGEAILPSYLRLQAGGSGYGASTATLPSPGDCTPLAHGWDLAAGEVMPLTLDLMLQAEAPNPTRNQRADFDLTFVLQELGAGHHAGPCSNSPPTGGAVASAGFAGGTLGTPGTPGTAAGRASAAGTAAPRDAETAAPEPWLPLSQLQSNVVANDRTPWPWLVLLSAAGYMATQFRRRTR